MTSQRERIKVLGAGIFSLISGTWRGPRFFVHPRCFPADAATSRGWAFAEAGWLAAINYAGYLSGALIASLISDLVLKDKLYRIGLVTAILSTAAMGMSTDPDYLGPISRFCRRTEQRSRHVAWHRAYPELADSAQSSQ